MNIKSAIAKIVSSNNSSPRDLFEERGRVYSFINPYGYHLLRRNYELYENLDGLFIDGIFMCLLTRLYYGFKVQRRSFDMTSLAKDCFEYLSSVNESIYFVGANEDEINATIKLLQKEYPKMNIAGWRDGYFQSKEERNICFDNIIQSGANFVVVGMGAVLQEQFVVDLKAFGFDGIAFTCGGYLRQASSGIDYYPKWVNKFHLRAFYRLIREKGMAKRLYNILIEFPIVYLYDRLCTKL